MALSNWDCLAFDNEGKPTVGNFQAGKCSVEIYKNWAYLREGDFIVQIEHGAISCSAVEIIAARHESQSAVFLFAKWFDYPKEGEEERESRYVYFCGIGCYGFRDDLDWLKENHPEEYAKIDLKFLTDPDLMVGKYSGPGDRWGYSFYAGEESAEYDMPFEEPDLGELWEGTSPATVAAFYEWLKTVAPEEYWSKININEAQRFNQGDAFFAAAFDQGIVDAETNHPVLESLETEGVQATKPGESKSPLIEKML